MTSLLPALAGTNYVYGSGTTDVGMTFDITAMLLDTEIAKATMKLLEGVAVDPETLAVDVIKSIGPKGNFLAHAHTVKHFRDNSSSVMFDRTMRDTWEANGSKSALERATEMAKDIAENHKPIPLAPEVAKGLDDILAEAVEEAGMTGWDEF